MVGVHWVTVLVCGHREVTINAHASLPSGLAGDYTFKTGVIRVRFAEKTYMEDSLFHEITHAVWDASGLRDMLRRKLRHVLTDAQIEDLEEDVMVHQTPGLLSTLKQAGWLTMPPPPSKE